MGWLTHRFWAVLFTALVLPSWGGEAGASQDIINRLIIQATEAYQAGDLDVAESKFRQAAERGDARSQIFLVRLLLREDRESPERLQEGLRWLIPLAEANDPEAITKLAQLYLQGRGVEKAPDTGFRLATRAAMAGYAGAQSLMGAAYLDGEGTARNPKEAAKWFMRAAYQEDAFAQSMLALLHFQGVGVHQDFVLAHMWINLAASSDLNAQWYKDRAQVEKKLSHDQVLEAQRLAREWTEFVALERAERRKRIAERDEKTDALLKTLFSVAGMPYLNIILE